MWGTGKMIGEMDMGRANTKMAVGIRANGRWDTGRVRVCAHMQMATCSKAVGLPIYHTAAVYAALQRARATVASLSWEKCMGREL